MSIYEGSVRRPIMTTLVFVAIAVFGIFSFSKLPIDLLPDIESNMIMVMETYPGASAEDIENNVTRPLENILNSTNYLKHITSKSQENYSLITLQFEFGHDIDALTNDVRDKLDMVSSALPDGAGTPIIFKFSTDMMPIMILSAQAKESTAALYKILDDQVANPLARIPGVGTVSVSGAAKRTVYIYCDPDKLEAYNLPIETISQVIAAENRNVPGGSFDTGNNAYTLRVKGEFKDPSEIENLIVAARGNQIIRVKDVARVEDTLEERAQKVTTFFTNPAAPEGYSGQQGAMIVIQKQSGSNTVEICEKVLDMLPRIQKTLPSDVVIGVMMDSSENIYATVETLEETIAFAMLFVAIVCFLFLGRWRAVVVIIITIPLSLVASFIYLLVADSSLNMISLSCLSIAIGNVVDDAIVVLENVTTHIERGSAPKQAAMHATQEVAISVIASTLTMIAVFFPLTMVPGMAGVLFKQLGWMMCIIMTISTLSALTFTPMLCSQMLKLKKRQSGFFKKVYGPIAKGLDKLDGWYERRIHWAVRHRWTVILSCIGFFFLSIMAVNVFGIESEFFPTNDSGRVGVSIELPIGTRVEKAEAVAKELTQKWMARYGKDMQRCNFTVGQAGDSNAFASLQSSGSHIISFNIMMVPSNERSIGLAQICDEMRADLKQMPELAKYQVNLGGSQSNSMGGQSMASFEIYGYDMDATRTVADSLAQRLRASEMISQVVISRSDYQPEIVINFDREKLAGQNLGLSTAASYVRNIIYGSQMSYFREDGEEYNIKVRYEPDRRTSIEDIENAIIPNGLGGNIRIRDIASVEESAIPPTIERKDRQRYISVNAIMADGYALSEGVEFGRSQFEKLDIPAGITVQVAGSYEDQQESNRDLGQLGLIIILLVFVVMAAQFESLTLPFIIMLSVPFAFSGIILALIATGTNMNIMSMLGGIMLIGIVVKNGIVLIDYTNLLRERGYGLINAAQAAARSRLRPILMTTLTTILGMVPMAISTGVGAEMWRPMAVSIIGGLMVSTVLTLIYVPSMFCVFGGVGIKRNRRKMRKQRKLDAYWREHAAEEKLVAVKGAKHEN